MLIETSRACTVDSNIHRDWKRELRFFYRWNFAAKFSLVELKRLLSISKESGYYYSFRFLDFACNELRASGKNNSFTRGEFLNKPKASHIHGNTPNAFSFSTTSRWKRNALSHKRTIHISFFQSRQSSIVSLHFFPFGGV